MNTIKLSLRLLVRDWKAGELTVLGIALIVAVSALTAVAFLTDRVGQAVEMRAAESLAADLRLRSGRPVSFEYEEFAATHDVDSARVTTMPSVVFSGDGNTLAAIRAVTDGYPLRGRLKTAGSLLADPRVEHSIPGPGEAWGSPRLLARLGIEPGTQITVGSRTLELTRVLTFRPDEGFGFTALAPALLINDADLESTRARRSVLPWTVREDS
jgi:putative ABC transport system permease protein